MATAKIATLLIRTVAKPLATSLKTQAANHESFKRLCIGIAQALHRSEWSLRYNLLPKAARTSYPSSSSSSSHRKDGQAESEGEHSKPRVRPLNEAKAIANGANFLSEAFLFIIAAGLILGESWRSSAKSKQQRNRTEERVEEVARAVEQLCEKLGVDKKAVGLESEEEKLPQERTDLDEAEDEANRLEASRHAAAVQHRLEEEKELERLRRAVQVLLTMAIQGGWLPGQEALDLRRVMEGREDEQKRKGTSDAERSAPSSPSASPSASSPSNSPVISRLANQKAAELAERLNQRHPESDARAKTS